MNLKQKLEVKQNAKKTGPTLRYTRIGEEWKKIVKF